MSSSPQPRPSYIPIPNVPLRSAMKHSQPQSPASSPSPARDVSSSPFHPGAIPSASSSTPDTSATGTHSPVAFKAQSQSQSQSPVQSGMPSPPLATPGFTPKVSFDTFENPSATLFSFTLHVQSAGYQRIRATRVFLCAASMDESGSEALDWALESLVQDGDELVVCRGVEKEDLEKDHDLVREEARELMRFVQEKSAEYDPDRKLSLIVEFVAGRVTDTLDRLIALYRPDSVVVGTRGQRNMMSAWGAVLGAPGMGSVSKYCLSHSPVPIIVVRPERKVRKVLAKRKADPKRGRHFEDLAPRTPSIQSLPLTPSSTKG